MKEMDLPDLPPGTEGYDDTVVVPPPAAKPEDCTKAEKEFQDHLNSLKIKLEDGSTRPMVERRGRDIAGKWIYLCFPCAAVCSGESVLQTHISGKKHKAKLALKNTWPLTIFSDHPYERSSKGETADQPLTKEVLDKMAESVKTHTTETDELDKKFGKYRHQECMIQKELDNVKAPIIGLEYLIEFLPEEDHHEPSFLCVLCGKHGHPRTIVNHLVSFGHRSHYLSRHFSKAFFLLGPYRGNIKYRDGVSNTVHRLTQRVQDTYGRRRPLQMQRYDFEKDKELISKWVFQGFHFAETPTASFEEVVNKDLIINLSENPIPEEYNKKDEVKKRDPSPPRVPAPRPNDYRGRRPLEDRRRDYRPHPRDRTRSRSRSPKRDHRRRSPEVPVRSRTHNPYVKDNRIHPSGPAMSKDAQDPTKRVSEHKEHLLATKITNAKAKAGKMLSYHEKNPEKHPLYPEEWKKFWNRRYKELQAERKDPTKYDFKPEWIVFWTKRMKELHIQELTTQIHEIYRNLNITPPPDILQSPERNIKPQLSPPPSEKRRSPPRRSPPRRSPPRRREFERDHRRSPYTHSRSPMRDNRNFDRKPYYYDRERGRGSMERRRDRSPMQRMRSPLQREEYARPHYKLPYERQQSPSPRRDRILNRSPICIDLSPVRDERPSPGRRGEKRNPSPPFKSNKPLVEGTEKISEDELKMNDSLSDWDSGSGTSLPSLKEVHPGPNRERSVTSHRSSQNRREQSTSKFDLKPSDEATDVVSSLRLLVALEDHLGSIGPKIVDLLTTALKMEKEEANSSENILDDEMKVALIETAKEKLKGALQAGLVRGSAYSAARTAVMRAASLTHLADSRARSRPARSNSKPIPSNASGVVDRAVIAEQIAAALIAQGKTDVSTEELEELVDAVVGMAEEKRNENKIITPSANVVAALGRNPNATSALQLLQNAYDENHKEEKVVAAEMDGLSDSDLETLLQNFAELSAEEQNGLIAYLKKLEVKDPKRVERLRAFVSAAVCGAAKDKPTPRVIVEESTPKVVNTEIPNQPPKRNREESDDEEYSVEDVFKSAAQKINEEATKSKVKIIENKVIKSRSDASGENASGSNLPNVSEAQFTAIANILSALQNQQGALTSIMQNQPQPVSAISPQAISSVTEPEMLPPVSGLADNIDSNSQYANDTYQQNDDWQQQPTNDYNNQYEDSWTNNQDDFSQNQTNEFTKNNDFYEGNEGFAGDNDYGSGAYNNTNTFSQSNYDDRGNFDDDSGNFGDNSSYNNANSGNYNDQGSNLNENNGSFGNYADNDRAYNDNNSYNYRNNQNSNFRGNNKFNNRGNANRGAGARGGNNRGSRGGSGGGYRGNRGGQRGRGFSVPRGGRGR